MHSICTALEYGAREGFYLSLIEIEMSMSAQVLDAGNTDIMRAMVSTVSRDLQNNNTVSQDAAANMRCAAQQYVDLIVGKVGKYLTTTYSNATYNQMFNDGRYIKADLDDRRRQSSAAADKANSQVYVVRERAATAEYAAGVSRVVARVAMWSVLVASFLLVATAFYLEATVSKPAYVVIAVLIGLVYLAVLVGMVRGSAGRRRTDWNRFYWGVARTADTRIP